MKATTAAMNMIQLGQVLMLTGTSVSANIIWADVPALQDHAPQATPLVIGVHNRTAPTDCAALCSNDDRCTAFFFALENGSCTPYATLHVNTVRLDPVAQQRYYEMSRRDCPMDKCYHWLRQVSLCLFLHREGHHNYTSSRNLCWSMGGHLPVLDTKRKNEEVRRFLGRNDKQPPYTYIEIFLDARFQPGDVFYRWSAGQHVANKSSNDSFWSPGDTEPQRVVDTLCMVFRAKRNNAEWVGTDCSHYKVPLVLCERNT